MIELLKNDSHKKTVLAVNGSKDPYVQYDFNYYNEIINCLSAIDRGITKIYYKYDAEYITTNVQGQTILKKEVFWIDLLKFCVYRSKTVKEAVELLKNTTDYFIYSHYIMTEEEVFKNIPFTTIIGKDGKLSKVNKGDGLYLDRICTKDYCVATQSDLGDKDLNLGRVKISTSPVYMTTPEGVNYIDHYKVSEVQMAPSSGGAEQYTHTDMMLQINKPVNPDDAVLPKISDLADCLISVNGRFCPTYYETAPHVETDKVYLYDQYRHLEPRTFQFTLKSDYPCSTVKFYDRDIKILKWENIKLSHFIQPANLDTEDLYIGVDFKEYPELEFLAGLETGRVATKIVTGLQMDEPFDSDNCLLMMNGSIVDPDFYEVDSNDPRRIKLKKMREFAYAYIESVRRFYYERKTTLSHNDYLVKATKDILSMKYSFVRLSSKLSDKKVKLIYDKDYLTDIPYYDETTFNIRTDTEDLITLNGLQQRFTWEDIDVVKYYPNIVPTLRESKYYQYEETTVSSEGKTDDEFNNYLIENFTGKYFRIKTSDGYIIKKASTLQEIRYYFKPLDASGKQYIATVCVPMMEKSFKDERLYFNNGTVMRICPILV